MKPLEERSQIIPDSIVDTIIALSKGIASLNDRYLDLESLSLYSGIGKTSLRHHVEADGLPAYFPKGKILVKKSDFDSWIKQYRYHKKQNDVDIQKLADEMVNEVRGKKSAKLAESQKGM